jgi:polyisoprenyl-phosphate glycosyltransferase
VGDGIPQKPRRVNTSPRISVAVPVFNEEENLPELLRRTLTTLHALPGGPHEIVFVDDGSRDRTPQILSAAVAAHPEVVVILLSRNFGHQVALTAALDHTSGDAVVVMDGDLQDAPEAIPEFVKRYLEGCDVVYARRVQRKEGLVLRACYWLFYRLLARLSRVQMPLDSGDFALLSRRVVLELRRTREQHRYLRGLRTWVGFRQEPLDVERADRHAGSSKYSVRQLVRLALNGIFAFSIVPLRTAALLGLFAITASGAFSVYALYARLMLNRSPQGFTAIILVVTFLSGVNLVFLGVIGEYVGRVYEEVKQRPIYIVDRILGPGSPAGSEHG